MRKLITLGGEDDFKRIKTDKDMYGNILNETNDAIIIDDTIYLINDNKNNVVFQNLIKIIYIHRTF